MLESKTYFIENRNQQIAYKKYGLQGDETIVFQHGLTSKKEDWDSPDVKGMTHIEFFVNKCYRCISIDCLSHGEKVPNLPKQQTMIVIYLLWILSL